MTKKEQKVWRKEMLKLMNEDFEWYKDETSERFRRIRELATKIEVDNGIFYYKQITKEAYEECLEKGMLLREIAEHFNVSWRLLRKWREENGYVICCRKSKGN